MLGVASWENGGNTKDLSSGIFAGLWGHRLDQLHVLFVAVAKETNSDNIRFDSTFLEISKRFLDIFLSDIWSRLQYHRHSLALKFAIGSDDSAQLLALIIKFQRIIHHGDIQFREICAMRTMRNNFINQWQRIYLLFYYLVEFAKI